MNSLISSMALSIASLGFLIIVLGIYLVKGKQNNGKGINKIFVAFVIYTIFCAFYEILLSISISRTLAL